MSIQSGDWDKKDWDCAKMRTREEERERDNYIEFNHRAYTCMSNAQLSSRCDWHKNRVYKLSDISERWTEIAHTLLDLFIIFFLF